MSLSRLEILVHLQNEFQLVCLCVVYKFLASIASIDFSLKRVPIFIPQIKIEKYMYMIIYNLCSFLRESAQGGPCVLTRLTNRVSFVEELGRKALQREERRVEEAILGKLQKIGQKTISNFSPFHLLQGTLKVTQINYVSRN